MKKVLFIGMILLSFSALRAQSEAVRFTVEVNTDSLLMGNLLQVSFTLENGQGQNFQAPYFTGFSVVSGPNYSSSMSIVNGRTAQRLTYTYQLMPQEVGNYYIEPASIKVDGQVLETLPLEVIVVPNPHGIQQDMPAEGQPRLQFGMPGLEGFDHFGFEGFEFPGMEPFNLDEFGRGGFGGFPNLDSLMQEFRNLQPFELPEVPGEEDGKPGKKRKTYKL